MNMGWTSLSASHVGDVKEFFTRQFGGEEHVLEIAIKPSEYRDHRGEKVAYIVYRYDDGHVGALVVLFYREKGEFFYKDMDENMGPMEHRCPAIVLDSLDPTDNEYALRWRERCRQALAGVG